MKLSKLYNNKSFGKVNAITCMTIGSTLMAVTAANVVFNGPETSTLTGIGLGALVTVLGYKGYKKIKSNEGQDKNNPPPPPEI